MQRVQKPVQGLCASRMPEDNRCARPTRVLTYPRSLAHMPAKSMLSLLVLPNLSSFGFLSDLPCKKDDEHCSAWSQSRGGQTKAAMHADHLACQRTQPPFDARRSSGDGLEMRRINIVAVGASFSSAFTVATGELRRSDSPAVQPRGLRRQPTAVSSVSTQSCPIGGGVTAPVCFRLTRKRKAAVVRAPEGCAVPIKTHTHRSPQPASPPTDARLSAAAPLTSLLCPHA